MDKVENAKFAGQSEMLANRVKKKFKHLKKIFSRQNIEVFRLYDWDIPEIRMVVDWYAGHLVIAEYTRRQSVEGWLEFMGAKAADALQVPYENLHFKKRKAGFSDGKRYERLNYTNRKIIVSERNFRFFVNPEDYIDTGLFSDHRNTRLMVKEIAQGRHFLNLYCYTGTFTCYAAKGGAETTTSVDRSETAINWLNQNLELNGLGQSDNLTMAMPVYDFLDNASEREPRYDLAVVDPPSFSTSRDADGNFDVSRDHPELLGRVAGLMTGGGILFFSTNHQDFNSRIESVGFTDVSEITDMTIPQDYVSPGKKIHRCWKILI